jgi:hypothetical protein
MKFRFNDENDMSTITCLHCRKILRTKTPVAVGRKVRSSCGEVFCVGKEPGPDNRSVDATTSIGASPKRTGRQKRSTDTGNSATDDRPSRRSKKKKASGRQNTVFLALGGVGLLAVFFGIAAFVWPGFFLTSKPASGGASLSIPVGADLRKSTDRSSPQVEKGSSRAGDQSIREIMMCLARGPESLGNSIGNGLKADDPAWEVLQGKTKEYLNLAKAMSAQEPPRGSKDSWATLTRSFAESASDLDRSVQEKNKDGALAAHGSLSSSCMTCHREHRGGQKGFGPKDGFGPKKGPPADGGN